MRVLALVCVVLFVSGCLVGEDKGERGSKQESKVKINVGGEEDTSIPWSGCERLLNERFPPVEAPDRSYYFLAQSYRHKNSCVSLYIGLYKIHQRNRMNGKPSPPPSSWKYGNRDKTFSYMEDRLITCKESNGKLSLVFPVSSYGHKDYASIDLECGRTTDELSVLIGLDDAIEPNKLAITAEHFRKNDMPTVFHAFDTDSKGVIKKHVKVVGSGGEKEIMLDNYKTQ